MAGTPSAASPSTNPSGSSPHPPHRRVVKAVVPPPAQAPVETPQKQEPDDSSGRKTHSKVPAIRNSALLHEQDQELEERWRKERLDERLEVQKQHRQDKVDLHRRNESPMAKPTAVTEQDAATKQSRNFSYSIEPEFPEHKRKSDEASFLPIRPLEEPADKRHRVDQDDQSNAGDEKKPWWNNLYSKAAICVVALIVAERLLLRSKN